MKPKILIDKITKKVISWGYCDFQAKETEEIFDDVYLKQDENIKDGLKFENGVIVKTPEFKIITFSYIILLNSINQKFIGIKAIQLAPYLGAIHIDDIEHITIDNCVIDGDDIDTKYGILIDGDSDYSDFVTVSNCEIYSAGGATFGGGISIKEYSHDITIINNYIHDCTEIGIQAQGLNTGYGVSTPYNILITGNRIETISQVGGEAGHGINIGYFVKDNVIVEKNYIKNAAGAGLATDQGIDGILYRNNIVVDCGEGILLHLTGDYGTPTNCEFYNNTIISTSASYPTGVRARSTTGTGHILKNNIFYSSYANFDFFHCDGTVAITSDNNCFYNSTGTYEFVWNDGVPTNFATWQDSSHSNQDANSISSDPLFVSASDYHLQSGSGCIDTGANTGIADDYDSAGRPQGFNWDMGAYERSLNAMTPIGRFW